MVIKFGKIITSRHPEQSRGKSPRIKAVILSIAKNLIVFITAFLLTSNICFAYTTRDIRWESLNLSPEQRNRIRILDYNWQRTSSELSSQIISEKNQLRYLLSNPCSSDCDIRNLQNRVIANQSILRYQAMSSFLQKRRLLNTPQRKKLHKFLLN